MNENLKLLRFYFLLLAIFTIGRWALSLAGVDYSKAHQVFSLSTLALLAAAHHAAFARAWHGYSLGRAAMLGATIGFVTQLVIFVSTALSYMLGITTFFNNPATVATPGSTGAVGFGDAMVGRSIGLVVNTIVNAIAALIGYAMGAALPRKTA